MCWTTCKLPYTNHKHVAWEWRISFMLKTRFGKAIVEKIESWSRDNEEFSSYVKPPCNVKDYRKSGRLTSNGSHEHYLFEWKISICIQSMSLHWNCTNTSAEWHLGVNGSALWCCTGIVRLKRCFWLDWSWQLTGPTLRKTWHKRQSTCMVWVILVWPDSVC